MCLLTGEQWDLSDKRVAGWRQQPDPKRTSCRRRDTLPVWDLLSLRRSPAQIQADTTAYRWNVNSQYFNNLQRHCYQALFLNGSIFVKGVDLICSNVRLYWFMHYTLLTAWVEHLFLLMKDDMGGTNILMEMYTWSNECVANWLTTTHWSDNRWDSLLSTTISVFSSTLLVYSVRVKTKCRHFSTERVGGRSYVGKQYLNVIIFYF